MSTPMRYRAIVFHPGSRTLWLTGRPVTQPQPAEVPVLCGQKAPDPAEIILEKRFRTVVFASGWARVHLNRLQNVRAEIHDAPLDA